MEARGQAGDAARSYRLVQARGGEEGVHVFQRGRILVADHPARLGHVLEQLDGRPEDAALRYLLALQLVRRRVLRIVDRPTGDAGDRPAGDELLLACRKRETEYRVPVVPPGQAAAAGIEERLSALLWSGGAA